MAGRPRRTRIYGANYNIGESYYKSALDTIDRKHLGTSPNLQVPGHGLKNDLSPTMTFKRALTDEPTSFDSNGGKNSFTSELLLDSDYDQDVQATLRKLRELKKVNAYILDEDNNPSIYKKKGLLAIQSGNRSVDDDEDNSVGISISRFQKKMIFDESAQSSSAALRANATKERLANIDLEISEHFDKQEQREKRSAHLKRLLNETEGDNNKVVKKVTF